MFVTRDDQIQGLTYLLRVGVRVLTVMEFILRRSLQQDQTKLPGLHPENRKKCTAQPTAERILKAFAQVSLTILKDGGKGDGSLVHPSVPAPTRHFAPLGVEGRSLPPARISQYSQLIRRTVSKTFVGVRSER